MHPHCRPTLIRVYQRPYPVETIDHPALFTQEEVALDNENPLSQ